MSKNIKKKCENPVKEKNKKSKNKVVDAFFALSTIKNNSYFYAITMFKVMEEKIDKKIGLLFVDSFLLMLDVNSFNKKKHKKHVLNLFKFIEKYKRNKELKPLNFVSFNISYDITKLINLYKNYENNENNEFPQFKPTKTSEYIDIHLPSYIYGKINGIGLKIKDGFDIEKFYKTLGIYKVMGDVMGPIIRKDLDFYNKNPNMRFAIRTGVEYFVFKHWVK